MVFLIFLLMGCGFFYFLAARPFFQSRAARDWVETPCRIVSSEVKSSSDSDGTTYRPEIVYTYKVAGREYRSDRYQFLRLSSSGRADKAAVVARYPRGKAAVCYVNPKAPAEAVLDRRSAPAGFAALFPLIFVAIGAGGLVWSIRGKPKAAALNAALAAGEPWRFRPDWAEGRVVSSSKRALWLTWAVAAAWNLTATPIAWPIIQANVLHRPLNPAAFVVLFPLAGLGMLAWAIFLTLRWLRFGESALEMASFPAVAGGAMEGTVRLNRPIRPEGPVRLRLNCMARTTTSSGDGNSTTERLVWQREETAEMTPTGDAFPVAFALPASASVTTSWNGGDGIFWRLEAHAKLPGVDYKAQFEFPVCAGELSPEAAAEADRVRTREQAEVAAYVQPASSRVRVTTPMRGGTEFYFPPGRSLVGTLIVGGILAGLIWGINQTAAHHAYGPVFGLGVAAFIVGFILSYIWTASVRVNVEAGMVTVTHKFLGIPTTRVLAAADAAEVKTDITASSGSSITYGLKIVCRDGREIGAGDRIKDQREAEWLASRMTDAILKP
ncbi:MAG: DUF3592 domain-containing protein [Chthoniobacteraceae bacterium]|nr:DUF3592 domain-containing protein [Chthoniobacteraceae bacterium]